MRSDVSADVRVTLVFDPFGIYASGGMRVLNLSEEERAFREIKDYLLREHDETGTPLTVIIERKAIPHFASYRGVRGIRIVDFTPTRRVREIIGHEPPEWLNDVDVYNWCLLSLKPPNRGFAETWEATLAAWLFPGITEATSIETWFSVMAQAPNVAGTMRCEPLAKWLQLQFSSLVREVSRSEDEVDVLGQALTESESPVVFAKTWVRRVALAPLLDISMGNPLGCRSADVISPKDRVLMRSLPLLFPLPPSIHSEVSRLFCDAIRKARLNSGGHFEDVALRLNAMWVGVDDELKSWLDTSPRAMTKKAADYLTSLPGSENVPAFRHVVSEHRPADAMPPWCGLDEHFESWVASYALWLRNTFTRRELPPPEQDPATGFSRWMKDNNTVSFSHPERSYLTISGTVRSALREGRTVIIVLVDAMAIQVVDRFREALTEGLGQSPTQATFVFSPIPTITEVCKVAITAGLFPDQCTGDFQTDLARAYNLRPEQLQVAANWTDAQRVRVTPETKLLAYRDNRLDDQLSMAGNFRELLQECDSLAPRISGLIRRLVEDCRCISGATPMVLLTADHGFTYGPAAGNGDDHPQQRHPHRCAISNSVENMPNTSNESMTFIDRDIFHNKNSYIAARGRSSGNGTLSGWVMSHGGLLPEEVVVPLVEWFGKEATIPWPRIEWLGDAYRDRGRWQFRMRLRNVHAIAAQGGEIIVHIAGTAGKSSQTFARLQPGQVVDCEIVLEADPPDGEDLALETTTIMAIQSEPPIRLDRGYRIRRARQLAERTGGQDDFESMF
jgi:hypothetical protein